MFSSLEHKELPHTNHVVRYVGSNNIDKKDSVRSNALLPRKNKDGSLENGVSVNWLECKELGEDININLKKIQKIWEDKI